MSTIFIIAAAICVAGVAGMFILSMTASKPSDLGVNDGRLAELPDSPNCVSTQTEKQDQWMAPLTYDGDRGSVLEDIRKVLQSMSNARIVEERENYLRAEFRSTFFRFVDDVEFLVEPETSRVHFRSASRVGYSDMGVNRDRMERIRELFLARRKVSSTN